MMANQPVNTRDLISDIDVGFLWWGYPLGLDYSINPPDKAPSETLRYPTDLGATFLTDFNPLTGIVTVLADPRVADNSIKVYDAGSNLFVELNGVVKVYPLARVRGVQIDAGPGNATIQVPGDPAPFGIQVNGGGHDTLAVRAETTRVNYGVNSGVVTFTRQPTPGFLRFVSSTVTFDGLSNLTIVGNGFDNATVAATSKGTPVTLFGLSTVLVGSSGTLGNVLGPVTIAGFGVGGTDLVINDSADTAPKFGIIGRSSVLSLSPAAITYYGADLHSLTVLGSSTAADNYSITGTPQNRAGNLMTTVQTGAGNDAVNVLSASSYLGLDLGAGQNSLSVVPSAVSNILSVTASGGAVALTVDDSSDRTPRSVVAGTVLVPVVGSGQGKIKIPHLVPIGYIRGFSASGEIYYDEDSLSNPTNLGLTIRTGRTPPGSNATGDSILLQTTPSSGARVILNEADRVSVASTNGELAVFGDAASQGQVTLGALYQNLALFHGTVFVISTSLDVENQDATGPQSVAISYDELRANSSAAVVFSGLPRLSYEGNSANDSYTISPIWDNNLVLHAGSGNDTFMVATAAYYPSSVVLDGGGGNDVLTIRDATPTRGLVYNVAALAPKGPTDTLINSTDLSGFSIDIHRIPQTTFYMSDGGDTLNLKGVAPGTALAVVGGAGNDLFSVQGPLPNAKVSIDGGGGVNTLSYASYPIQSTAPAVTATSLSPAPVPPGIVAWYKAEGNANDAISALNGTAANVSYGPGEVGQAFQMSGSVVDVPDSPALDTPQVTVEAWVKSAQAGSMAEFNDKYIAEKGFSYGLFTSADGGLVFYIRDHSGTAYDSPDAGAGIWDGNWHHVAGTYDGNIVRLYVDGKEVGDGTKAFAPIEYHQLDVPTDLRLGNAYGPDSGADALQPSGFDGSIDELSIYSRALTAAEIQAIYNAGSAGKSNNPPPPPPPSTATGVEVDLPLGTATGLAGGVTHIQNLIGSPGNDVLVGNGGNMIDGGGGQDLLIAGPTASTLEGSGADVLVGGQTADDQNMTALEQVLMDWTDPTADFPTRVSRIRQGLFATGKVTANHQHNVLTAGAGLNLFFASASDTTNKSNGDVSIEL
jgi:hypothetical protein